MALSEIGRYRIIRRLGAGGMGEVFLAEDGTLGRKVAIKMLAEHLAHDADARRRLTNEARAAASLDHPNICAVYEVGDEAGHVFIAMQYIEGDVLADRILDGALPASEVVEIGLQVADALADAHTRGIIHRDIKPQNVMVTPRGQVKVLDFGLAALTPGAGSSGADERTLTRLTQIGTVVGTPGFMSPEQVQGKPLDARSDIFSLGILLYECATGARAYEHGTPLEVSVRVVTETLPAPSTRNPAVPPALDRVVARATAKDPSARYASASALRDDLLEVRRSLSEGTTAPVASVRPDTARTAVVTGDTAPATAQAPVIGTASSRFLRRPVALVAAVVVALMVGIAAWRGMGSLTGSRTHVPPPEATSWYDRGTANIREGAYFQASKALERALSIDGSFALAHARLAEAYAEMELTDRAREELLQALALEPSQSGRSAGESAYLDAVGATLRRDFTTAIARYSAVVDLVGERDKAVAYVDLGRAYEKADNSEQALESYRKATEHDPQSAVAFLRSGILLGRGQGLAQATEALASAETIYRAMSNAEGVAQVLFERGAMLARTRQLAQARTQLEQALEMSRSVSNQVQSIRTQLQLSGVYYAEGNAAQAQATASDAISAAQTANMRTLATNGMIDLGYTLQSRGAFADARTYFQRALEAARQDKTARTEARALLALGSLSAQEGKLDEATASLESSLRYFQPAGYRKETSNALILLGRTYAEQGKYDVAQKALAEQLEVARQAGDPGQLAASHASLGVLLGISLERYTDALSHLDESYRINQSLGAQVSVGWDQMNRASMLWPLGRYDEAAAALTEARAIADKPEAGFKEQLAWVELTAAQMALSQGKRAEASGRAQSALDLAGREYAEVSLQAKQTLAVLRVAAAGERGAAVQLADEAVTEARALKQPRLTSSALLAAAEVHLLAGAAQEAASRARDAQRMAAAAGQLDSEWRAWLLSARAMRLAGDSGAAYDDAAHADAQRALFASQLGADAYRSYARRPDIQARLTELMPLLASTR